MFEELITKYIPKNSKGYYIYITHVNAVANAVKKICKNNPNLKIDNNLAYNAAILHDIGICMVDAPIIGCHGFSPYIQHGIYGRLILEDEGLSEYAKFCETHIGTGLYATDVISQKLPLPIKDMIPLTIEEEIICFADNFFSKSHGDITKPEQFEKVLEDIKKHGERGYLKFKEWCDLFDYSCIYRD